MNTPGIADFISWGLVAVGVVFNLGAAWKTWQGWATDDERFWAPLLRLFKRKPASEHRTGTASGRLVLSAKARGYKQYGPLPDMDDQEAFSSAVNARLNELFKRAGEIDGRLTDQGEKLREEIRASDTASRRAIENVAKEVSHVHRKTQAELLTAVRCEVFGSVLVVIGLAGQVTTAL